MCNGGVCANGCESGEDLNWCDDCKNAYCGNSHCDVGTGETYTTCPQDCIPPCTEECTAGSKQCISGQLQECTTTGDADSCYEWGNAPCTTHSECTTSCGADTYCNPSTSKCEAKCPNGQVDPGETCSSCPADVGKCNGEACSSGLECQSGKCISTGSGCSQKICFSSEYKTNDGCCYAAGGETCSNSPTDCGACTENCNDDIDNNGNGLIDCQDTVSCPAPATPCATCKEYKCSSSTYDWSCGNSPTTIQCGTPKDCDYLDTDCKNYYDVTRYCDGSGNCGNPACSSYTNVPSTTQCGTDTSCAYTGCNGNCLRIGTWLDYHCSGLGTCIYDTTSCSATCAAGTKCSAGSYIPAAETCGNGIDEDCNGADLPCGCIDNDKDGYNISAPNCGQCKDCDDTSININPAKTEVCNNLDDNCDGQKNEDCES